MARFNTKAFIVELKRRKQGLIVGAITGLIAAEYAIKQGADLNTIITAGKGLLDNFMTRSTAVDVATWKLRGTFMFLGAAAGAIVDKIMSKKW